MRYHVRSLVLRAAALLAFTALAGSAMAQTVAAASPAPAQQPQSTEQPQSTAKPSPRLEIPAGQRAVLTVQGKGLQVYRCDKVKTLWGWVLVGPDAVLTVSGVKVGTHTAGPTWSYRNSSVKGKVLTTAPSPDPDAVPWLLLEATDATGADLLNDVSYIRRSDTRGGKASAEGCDAEHAGTVARVPYSATYTFYAPGGDGSEALPR